MMIFLLHVFPTLTVKGPDFSGYRMEWTLGVQGPLSRGFHLLAVVFVVSSVVQSRVHRGYEPDQRRQS